MKRSVTIPILGNSTVVVRVERIEAVIGSKDNNRLCRVWLYSGACLDVALSAEQVLEQIKKIEGT